MRSDVELDKNVKTHAVEKVAIGMSLVCEELKTKGYSVVSSELSDEDLQALRDELERVEAIQADELGETDILETIKDRDLVRCLAGYSKAFAELCHNQPLLNYAQEFLGQYMVLMSQNGIINRPNNAHDQFTWHRDLNYQHFTSSRPLALSALLALDPFTKETGGTYVLEGTHRQEEFPSKSYVIKNQMSIECNPGDWILFDSMIFHRTGRNQSRIVRRAINHIITPPFIAQQYSFKAVAESNGIHITSDSLRRFLGYEYQTPRSVLEWRKERYERAKKK